MAQEIHPLPTILCQKIATYAVQLARESMSHRGWKSGSALVPEYREGYVGIRSEVHYLYFQEHGIQPFQMQEGQEGKIVPINNGVGGIRFVRVKDVGKPGYVWIPGKGNVWRDKKWHHPGIKATNFMQDAIDKSTAAYWQEIQSFQYAAELVAAMGELP